MKSSWLEKLMASLDFNILPRSFVTFISSFGVFFKQNFIIKQYSGCWKDGG